MGLRDTLRPRRTGSAAGSPPPSSAPTLPTEPWASPSSGGATRAPAGGDHPGGGRREAPGQGSGRVATVQRAGAVLLAVVLATFGLLGFLDGLAYFSTEGGRVAGLSSNGLLSTISVLTAALLVAAAVRGARTASTVMLVLGGAFLLSALANLAVLNSTFNILAFSMANVVFSLCAAVFLLVLGAYGRVSGNLPEDSPYRAGDPADSDAEYPEPERYAVTPQERAVEQAMREAERAVAERRATAEQARRVEAMARVRTRADRRRVWTECDRTAIG